MTALDDVAVGEVWTPSALQCLRRAIEEEGGLSWTIVEVLPVHEAIKSGKTSALRAKCASAARRLCRPSLLSLSLSQVHRQLEGVHEEPGCCRHHHDLLRLHAGRQLDQDATRLQVRSQFSPTATAEKRPFSFRNDDDSIALAFDYTAAVAFDAFVMKREGVEQDYSEEQIEVSFISASSSK